MSKLKLYLPSSFVIFLLLVGLIIWQFGFRILFQLILSITFIGLTAMLGLFFIVAVIAKHWKISLLLILPLILSIYSTYLCLEWKNLEFVSGTIIVFVVSILFVGWYLSEPNIRLIDRFKSAEKLEKEGKYLAAAKKYEKEKDFKNAARMYEIKGLLENAAWSYEKAMLYEKVAEIYEQLYKKENDTYYLREAYDFWRKAGDIIKAVKCLEKFANEEPWFWEDVAKIYEEINDKEKAKSAWLNALKYYLNEVQKEGVFWEDIAKIYEKLDNKDEAINAYKKFLDYCLQLVEEDGMWWKHIAETYEILGYKDYAKKAWQMYITYKDSVIGK
ncbi:MAG: GlcNAc transferase [Nitrososphaeria archaeon]|nr:GlcNAc transferase [Nitrososphaeria archaeon]